MLSWERPSYRLTSSRMHWISAATPQTSVGMLESSELAKPSLELIVLESDGVDPAEGIFSRINNLENGVPSCSLMTWTCSPALSMNASGPFFQVPPLAVQTLTWEVMAPYRPRSWDRWAYWLVFVFWLPLPSLRSGPAAAWSRLAWTLSGLAWTLSGLVVLASAAL